MNEATRSTMFSSATDDWATPQEFFDRLNHEFCFTLDACASDGNAKCDAYFTREEDALTCSWLPTPERAETGTVWMNPPYGRGIGAWVKKAYETSTAGRTVVCLLPARTDTAWWHDYIQNKAEVRFVRGRLKFGGAKNSAPFPSVVVVFRASED